MRKPLLVLASALLVAPSVLVAATPGNVRDLVGARAAGGEETLQSRGFVHIKTDRGDDRLWSYWWQPSQKECLSVAVVDGRFDSITSSPAPDCNQRTGKGSDGAAVAAGVGIVALIGALALAHKSKDHANGEHYADQGQDNAYERGYRDGLYNQSYHNYDRSEPYSSGYQAGVAQRGRETSYRGVHRAHAGGYAPSVDVSDLVDARAPGAETQMQSRGFRNVNGLKSGNTSYTIWFNDRTRQCIQMGVAEGRVQKMADIGNSPHCR
ncbi:MAG: hypothetical protein EOO83_00825 [Oxalobacteraceae bacterium]|nr:MAG: hypothetical protein EOO83_00825 [Oxalobacteraceae bacterium]